MAVHHAQSGAIFVLLQARCLLPPAVLGRKRASVRDHRLVHQGVDGGFMCVQKRPQRRRPQALVRCSANCHRPDGQNSPAWPRVRRCKAASVCCTKAASRDTRQGNVVQCLTLLGLAPEDAFAHMPHGLGLLRVWAITTSLACSASGLLAVCPQGLDARAPRRVRRLPRAYRVRALPLNGICAVAIAVP